MTGTELDRAFLWIVWAGVVIVWLLVACGVCMFITYFKEEFLS